MIVDWYAKVTIHFEGSGVGFLFDLIVYLKMRKVMLRAVVFHGIIVVLCQSRCNRGLSCTAYHGGTFIEAEIVEK